MDVSVRELKANLSAVLRQVEAGQSAVITAHRKPVAQLTPLQRPGDTAFDRLLAAGLVTERPRPGGLAPRMLLPLPPGVGSLSDAVIEGRG